MSVHYKFKSETTYYPVKFDGVYISVSDLKAAIIQKKMVTNSDLQLQNEQTGQIYTDDQSIPKNTNIVVTRMPVANSNRRTRQQTNQPYPARFSNNSHSAGQVVSSTTNNGSISNPGGSIGKISNTRHHHNNNNNHHHNNSRHTSTMNHINSSSLSGTSLDSSNGSREALELVSTRNMSEEEKIKYIQSQSAKDFDPARYVRGARGTGTGGRGTRHIIPGPGYTCKKCGISGHFINDCKGVKVKRASGIPRDFLVKVDSKTKGAMVSSGEFFVPKIDFEAYNNPKVEKAPFFEDGTPGDDPPASIKL